MSNLLATVYVSVAWIFLPPRREIFHFLRILSISSLFVRLRVVRVRHITVSDPQPLPKELTHEQVHSTDSARARKSDSAPRVQPVQRGHRVLQEGLRGRGIQPGAGARRSPHLARGPSHRP